MFGDNVPEGIIFIVFSYVSFESYDYFKLSQVSRQFKEWTRSDNCCAFAVWRQISESQVESPYFNTIRDFFKRISFYTHRNKKIEIILKNGYEKLAEEWTKRYAIEWEKFRSNYDENTALDVAIIGGRMKLFRFFLSIVHDQELLNRALHVAISHNGLDYMKILIEQDADVEALLLSSMLIKHTPLSRAVNLESIDAIRLLLECKADPNIRNTDGHTVLMIAASKKNREMMQLLVDFKANIEESVRISDEFYNNPSSRFTSFINFKYMRDAKEAEGVDRHLFGLRMILSTLQLNDKELETPSVFTDKAYQKGSHWNLSTSHCGSSSLSLFGFGPVVADGFGIGYMIKNDSISFNVTSRYLNRINSSTVMTLMLKESLLHMQALVLATPEKYQKHSSSFVFTHPTNSAMFRYPWEAKVDFKRSVDQSDHIVTDNS